jgi:hypothetical protein
LCFITLSGRWGIDHLPIPLSHSDSTVPTLLYYVLVLYYRCWHWIIFGVIYSTPRLQFLCVYSNAKPGLGHRTFKFTVYTQIIGTNGYAPPFIPVLTTDDRCVTSNAQLPIGSVETAWGLRASPMYIWSSMGFSIDGVDHYLGSYVGTSLGGRLNQRIRA